MSIANRLNQLEKLIQEPEKLTNEERMRLNELNKMGEDHKSFDWAEHMMLTYKSKPRTILKLEDFFS